MRLRGCRGKHDTRRDRLQALRHLRLPGRSHGRHRPRARPRDRRGRASRPPWRSSAGARARRAGSAPTCAAARRSKAAPSSPATTHDRSEARVVALFKGNEPVAELRRRRGGAGRARRHSFLCRERRAGRRHRACCRAPTRAFGSPTRRKLGQAYGHLGRVEQGSLKVGDTRRGDRRRRAPQRDAAQSHRHPPAARGAAQGAGHARHAEGLARRARPPAVRLLALRGRSRPRSFARSSGRSTRRSAPTHRRKRG